MRYVFVRHGHYGGSKLPAPQQKLKELTERGIRGAVGAGEYLAEREIVPDVVLHTDNRRTEQTADIVLQQIMVNVSKQITSSGHGKRAKLPGKLQEWMAEHDLGERDTLMFVGHGNSQNALRIYYPKSNQPPSDKKGHAAVLVLHVTERDGVLEITEDGYFEGLLKKAKVR